MAEASVPPQALAADELAQWLLAGSAALFPTDTVPALAARPEAAAQLWQLKQRPARKPMILMGADAEALFAALERPIAPEWSAMAQRCWPGAVTLVLPARGALAQALHSEGSSLGLRIPACPLALELLRRSGPLATTSANRSSEPPCRTAAEAAALFPALALLGPLPWPDGSGQPSTVLAWVGGDGDCAQGDAEASPLLNQGGRPSSASGQGLAGRNRGDPLQGRLDQPARPTELGGPPWPGQGPMPPASGAATTKDVALGANPLAGGPGRWQILRSGALMPKDLLPGA
jgi:L-threonylcarbamoyladenylate synthase